MKSIILHTKFTLFTMKSIIFHTKFTIFSLKPIVLGLMWAEVGSIVAQGNEIGCSAKEFLAQINPNTAGLIYLAEKPGTLGLEELVVIAVSRNDEFCIQNEEFCIQNEEFCIQNGISYSK